MARFDWRHAIKVTAFRCEVALMLGDHAAAEKYANYAAWLARSYGWRYRTRAAREAWSGTH